VNFVTYFKQTKYFKR